MHICIYEYVYICIDVYVGQETNCCRLGRLPTAWLPDVALQSRDVNTTALPTRQNRLPQLRQMYPRALLYVPGLPDYVITMMFFVSAVAIQSVCLDVPLSCKVAPTRGRNRAILVQKSRLHHTRYSPCCG